MYKSDMLFLAFLLSVIGGAVCVFCFWLGPMGRHNRWVQARNTCSAANSYFTNERSGNLIICRKLSDHSLLYIDRETGLRLVEE